MDPPATAIPTRQTLADVAQEVPDLSTFADAVGAAGLWGVLESNSTMLTVFAPSNDAFDAMLAATGLNASQLLEDDALLASLLLLHIALGEWSVRGGEVCGPAGEPGAA